MVLLWAIAGSGTVAAGAVCLRLCYRWQSKAEAGRIVRAIDAGDAAELALLLAERAYPDAVRDWFGDPLPIVAVRRFPAMVGALLASGRIAVDERGAEWKTALMHAAAAGDDSLCRLLLERGADRDARDAFGRDAAWWAEQAGHSGLASALRRR